MTGDNGLLTKAGIVKNENSKSTAKEKIKLAIISSYNENGKLDNELLKRNLNQIEGLNEEISEITFPLLLKIDEFSYMIYENLDVSYVDSITINFDLQGGTGTVLSIEKKLGENITLPTYNGTKESSKFIGWSTQSDTIKEEYLQGDLYNNDKHLVLYAVWVSDIYIYNNGIEANQVDGISIGKRSTDQNWNDVDKVYFDGDGTYSSGTITKNDDNIYATTTHNNKSGYGCTWCYLKTNKLINLNNFDKIKIDYSYTRYGTNGSQSIMGRLLFLDKDGTIIKSESLDKNGETVVSLSDVNEECFIELNFPSSFSTNSGGTMTVENIKLEI